MGERFTYFRSDGSSDVRTEAIAPLPRAGEVWVRGAYKPGVLPSPLEVRVGKAGVRAWVAMHWLQLVDNEFARVLEGYGHAVTEHDLGNALWFYRQNRDSMDARIRDELAAV